MDSVSNATATPEDGTQMSDATERLLDAAVASIAEHGFDAARVADIARSAGLTTGAIYARWPSKDALIVDAVRYIASRCIDVDPAGGSDQSSDRGSEDDAGDSEGHPVGGASVIDALIESSADFVSPENEAVRDVMLEAFVSARRNSNYREMLSGLLNDQAATIGAMLTEGKAAGLVKPHISTAAVVALYQALSVGMHLVMSSQSEDNRVSVEEWRELMKHVTESLSTQS